MAAIVPGAHLMIFLSRDAATASSLILAYFLGILSHLPGCAACCAYT
jgi:hypothetical protein